MYNREGRNEYALVIKNDMDGTVVTNPLFGDIWQRFHEARIDRQFLSLHQRLCSHISIFYDMAPIFQVCGLGR